MIIKGGRYFDSETLEFFDNRQFWIEDGKIKDMAKSYNHNNQEVINFEGYLVLPGWIDAHLHLTLSGGRDPLKTWHQDGIVLTTIKIINYLWKHLQAGVTVVRDLGGDGDVVINVKKALQAGIVKSPEIYTAGKALTMTGGHIYQISKEVDGQDVARKFAREELKKGVDCLKVIATGGILTPGVEPGSPQLTKREIAAIVEEGHKAGRKISSHAEGREGILNSIQAGVDTIEHGIGLDRELVELMIKKSMVLIPTLAAPRLILKNRVELPKEMVKKAEKIVEIHKASFGLAYKNNCCIAVGTDAGTPFNSHGQYGSEIKELLAEGMRVEEVLRAASLNGARAIGIEDRCGNITPGMDTNLTIIQGLSCKGEWFYRVKYIMHKGKLIEIH